MDVGQGQPVVLLHGIGVSHKVWQYMPSLLGTKRFRLIGFDLLGFGASPKPEWLAYTADDHARAVIAGMERLGVKQAILVGHSMGSLVAVRVARLRPDLVCHLILYQVPIYEGLPDARRYNLRRDWYFKLYRLLISSPELASAEVRSLRKTIARMVGFTIRQEIWLSFTRSLEHTIIEQHTMEDMRHLNQPIDVIYGSLDLLVIRGRPRKVLDEVRQVQTHTIIQKHRVSLRASKFIAARIEGAANVAYTEKSRRTRVRRRFRAPQEDDTP